MKPSLVPIANPPQLICLGMCVHDCIYVVPAIPTSPTKVLATEYRESGGGMAANAAVAASRLGARVKFWGRVGDDALGHRITTDLAAEGVDVSHVRRLVGVTSCSTAILIDANGERMMCSFNDPALDSDPAWLPLADVDQSDAALVDVRWPAGAHRLLQQSRAAGKVALLDADVGPTADVIALMAVASHVAFSEPGLRAAFGGAGVRDQLEAAARCTSGAVGVTLGERGYAWLDGNTLREVAGVPVLALDTLAAGDVWHGAFAVALAEGAAHGDAARFANTAAAIKCERPGGRAGAPTRKEVSARLRILSRA
ncbi:MAG: hypothetical protein JSR18_13325 [Proteobacteria bacterium]|nr:hypothetical protein [Pseudomonadota bacterium]